jgi:predicted nuclease of predicted toxin-antitoxin system
VKVLLDEMLPAAVAGLLPDHAVATAQAAGYTGLLNGELMRRAVADGYDVLVTADRNLAAQQNVPASGIAVVLVRGSRMADIEPQTARIRAAVAGARPGKVTRVEPG